MASKSVTIRDFRTELPGKLSDAQTYSFDTIKSTNRNKRETFYNIIVRVCVEATDTFLDIDDSYFDSSTELPAGAYGWVKVLSKIGVDGKIKKSSPTFVRVGKNIGKANQTNAFTQALRDALSKYNKQKAKSAESEFTVIDGVKLYPPMLAQVLDSQKSSPFDEEGTLYTQYKLNGVRAVATAHGDGVMMYSRTRKVYPGFDYIKAEVTPVLEKFRTTNGLNVYLDGEVYKHGVDLQIISGTARRELNNSSQEKTELEYHVYDVFVPEQPDMVFSERLKLLNEITSGKYLKVVDTYQVDSRDELNEYYADALGDDYEGVMLRRNEPYVYSYNDYHSKSLLKVKPTHDAEYKIIGYTAGTQGKSENALMFELEITDDKKLTINLGMEIDERKRLYNMMSVVEDNGKSHFENNYLGKMLTIYYDELSTDGVPVRSRTDGIVIRDYE